MMMSVKTKIAKPEETFLLYPAVSQVRKETYMLKLLAADSSSSSPNVVVVCLLFVVYQVENCLLTAT